MLLIVRLTFALGALGASYLFGFTSQRMLTRSLRTEVARLRAARNLWRARFMHYAQHTLACSEQLERGSMTCVCGVGAIRVMARREQHESERPEPTRTPTLRAAS